MLIYADPALLNAHPKHNTNKYNSFLTFIKISTKRRFSLEILGKIFIPFDFKAHIFSTKVKHFLETSSYCNSVLQALYYCKPFRECVNNFPQQLPPPPTSLPPQRQVLLYPPQHLQPLAPLSTLPVTAPTQQTKKVLELYFRQEVVHLLATRSIPTLL
jgi:hypothetical protein